VWHLPPRPRRGGAGSFEFIHANELAAAFDELNRLHVLRWGYPAFAGERLRFHLEFAQLLAAAGQLAMSRLKVAGRIVSMAYDVRLGARQYNLKMGFDPRRRATGFLGLIHFGHALKRRRPRVSSTYDFLAGPGRRADSKCTSGNRTSHSRPSRCCAGRC